MKIIRLAVACFVVAAPSISFARQAAEPGSAVSVTPPAQPYIPQQWPTIDWDKVQNRIEGQVSKVDVHQGWVRLAGSDKQAWLVPVSQRVTIKREGQNVRLRDLKEGDSVRLEYDAAPRVKKQP